MVVTRKFIVLILCLASLTLVYKWATLDMTLVINQTLPQRQKSATPLVTVNVSQTTHLPTTLAKSDDDEKLFVQRAKYVRRQCNDVYHEQLPVDFGKKCRDYQGYDSFMISPELMLSVPNKCASQYLNQLSFALLGLTDDDLKPGTPMYSYRSSVRAIQHQFTTTQVRQMCQTGEKVLFVRHPILRLISAWNDKFSLANNGASHGLWYGMNLLRGWSKEFPADFKFMNNEIKQKRSKDKNCASGKSQKAECLPSRHRDHKQNPDHLIDFYDFVTFLITKNPIKVDAHFSPITSSVTTRTTTRNVCSFNYTAVIKIESMKTELAQLFADHDIAIPDGFDGLRHTVNGGTSGTLSQNQDKAASLLTSVPLETREGLRAFYERDFALFDYVYEVASNRIY